MFQEGLEGHQVIQRFGGRAQVGFNRKVSNTQFCISNSFAFPGGKGKIQVICLRGKLRTRKAGQGAF